MNRVASKVALITGGAPGMGAVFAQLLVAEGASAVLADVLDADGETLAAELGEAARFVNLGVLVNNAGIANGWCDDDLRGS